MTFKEDFSEAGVTVGVRVLFGSAPGVLPILSDEVLRRIAQAIEEADSSSDLDRSLENLGLRGCGHGYGSEYGYGFGSGDGYGHGYGHGYGNGSGFGNGYGYGSAYGYGSDDGFGDGEEI